MSGKLVFLDVDGTYADYGDPPSSHERAVVAARAAGHRVFLCTGRPRSMLPERITGVGFDGIVASAGAWVGLDGQVLRDLRFPPELARRTVAVLRRHDIAFILEAPDASYDAGGVRERFAAMLAQHRPSEQAGHGPHDVLDALRPWPEQGEPSFAKITFIGSRLAPQQLADELGEELTLLPSSVPGTGTHAGEIQMAGVHKAVGVAVVADHLGVAREDLVAFGDGANDVEMLQYVGTGVAIRGGDPRALAAADLLADGPRHEGLARAFAALGLLGTGGPV